ncbi:CD225/dispanin family protein [Catellatospora sp. NEAU-YM18]|nr:CD225/dispanin family protein [Catellatospora tritici]
MSIIAVLLCPPLGIMALISANRVNPLLREGDYAGAQAALATSRKWSRPGVIVGLALWTIGCVCCAVLVTVLGVHVLK